MQKLYIDVQVPEELSKCWPARRALELLHQSLNEELTEMKKLPHLTVIGIEPPRHYDGGGRLLYERRPWDTEFYTRDEYLELQKKGGHNAAKLERIRAMMAQRKQSRK